MFRKKQAKWKRAGLKSEQEYHELLRQKGYQEAKPKEPTDDKGFPKCALLHIGNGVFAFVEPLAVGNRVGVEQ